MTIRDRRDSFVSYDCYLSAVAEDYLLVRKDRPVPLCWRTPFQRQQSGKRHTLNQHSRHCLCHSKISEIICVFGIILSLTCVHYLISWNNCWFAKSLSINKSEKSLKVYERGFFLYCIAALDWNSKFSI